MNEQDIQTKLSNIEQQLVSINKKTPSGWGALGRGVITGVGSVVGVALAIAVIGFILNILGIIPAFRTEVDSWKQLLNQTQSYKAQIMPNK